MILQFKYLSKKWPKASVFLLCSYVNFFPKFLQERQNMNEESSLIFKLKNVYIYLYINILRGWCTHVQQKGDNAWFNLYIPKKNPQTCYLRKSIF